MKGTPLNDALVDYMNELFPAEDDFLRSLKRDAEAAGLPAIQISPEQGAFMGVFLKAIGARRVIEVGTLGGYSAIIMAHALPEDGRVISLEIDPMHAEFARNAVREAGLEEKITIKVGTGIDLLERELAGSGPYDFAFIDADKPSYCRYVDLILPMMRPGGVIAGDNALAWGEACNPETEDENARGIQAFNRHMSEHPDIDAAIVPIGDGLCLGVVRNHTTT